VAELESLREFEFLPNLPKSNLDDRTFNDLVEECILRIPRYCPEWTNHNPGDPGITLIELFAWLTDQMLYRFNQVPRRYYVAFLELLGIRLQSAMPAWAELTFYLTKAQSEVKQIPAGTEVATVRTETEEAVVFTTTQNLVIGQPRIKHLFTAVTDIAINSETLQSPFYGDGELNWNELGNLNLFDPDDSADPTPGNCFYLVLETVQPEPSGLATLATERSESVNRDSLAGNVLVLTFKGSKSSTTGIQPDDPPLRWEAWVGDRWDSTILRSPQQDDKTKGFSFSSSGETASNPETEGADVILHLPQSWHPQELIENHRGYWIRCVYAEPKGSQTNYQRSPVISGITVRSIGGAVNASECVHVEEEFLGISNGKSGQTFQIQGTPLLERKPGEEFIQVKIGDSLQDWQEVPDFGGSNAESKHYMIDSHTGIVQFGPLVREPSQLREASQERSRLQPWGKRVASLTRGQTAASPSPLISSDVEEAKYQEFQYGCIPPFGSEISMRSYRIGGGSRGNVGAEKLTVLKQAIPYVKQVINYEAAQGGKDKESLDDAVIKVPEILRTSKTAVIPEDFENIATKSYRSIYRAYCPPCDVPGIIRLLITRDPRKSSTLSEAEFQRDFPSGIHPNDLSLEEIDQAEIAQLKAELEQRKSLGIQVELADPTYVGVKVIVEVMRDPKYRHPQVTSEIEAKILNKLYYFLNPITGGFDQKGWQRDRPVAPADIIAQLQKMPEVEYVAAVKLFSVRRYSAQSWVIASDTPEPIIHPGKQGFLCSWRSNSEQFDRANQTERLALIGHQVQFVD
jgi:predicted phage baseplate assembly protein